MKLHKWSEEAQKFWDRLEKELQKIRDSLDSLRTTAAPVQDLTTLAPVETTQVEI